MSLLHQIEEAVTGLGCFLIVASISLQVFCRYVLNSPLSWPEEVAKLAFVWASLFGATVGVRRKAHIAIEALVLRLPPRVRLAFGLCVHAGVLAVLATLLWSGVQMVRMASASILPAINVPVAYLYLPIPVCSALMMTDFAALLWRDAPGLAGRPAGARHPGPGREG